MNVSRLENQKTGFEDEMRRCERTQKALATLDAERQRIDTNMDEMVRREYASDARYRATRAQLEREAMEKLETQKNVNTNAIKKTSHVATLQRLDGLNTESYRWTAGKTFKSVYDMKCHGKNQAW